ncbi:MAG: DUF1223 domain-containing protein [Phycisphaerales bacterium]|nr:DUF1223 domain-containing protein [Phycisphaerales bacterium]
MGYFSALTLLAAVSIGFLGDGPSATPPTKPATGGPVVVELFTSEGCNSCPPADDLLGKLAKEQDARPVEAAGSPGVIFLAFHVDYWDKLGWPDRFATSAATERQRGYSRALQAKNADRDGGGMYTPQMIVGGDVGFVGSSEARARHEIKQPRATKGGESIRMKVGERKPGEPVRLEIALADIPADAQVLAAITEDGLSSAVKRGENAGATLHHDRVVRAFVVVKAAEAKSMTLTPPKDLVDARARVVVLVQEKGHGKMLAAVEQRLVKGP